MSTERDYAIKVSNVSKSFRLPHEQQSSLKGKLINFKNKGYEIQDALKDISFEVKHGEFFGIVGRNGSGKSTLLKMLAGIYKPDSGSIEINGKLTPFIELGVGFNFELTGRDNVFLNGALLGFNRKEMEAMYDDIVEFAELGRFMDQKLKNYSSGMQVRLAFSIAIRAETDILVLDEVLAVGDANFQKKCFDYFKQLKNDGTTVILVSHDATTLQEYCDRGILIEEGVVQSAGLIDHVINKYVNVLNKSQETSGAANDKDDEFVGTGNARITHSSAYNTTFTSEKEIFTTKDKMINFAFTVEVVEDIEDPICGITLFDQLNQVVFALNNLWTNEPVKDFKKGDIKTIRWEMPNIFSTGEYSITSAIATDSGRTIHDLAERSIRFKVEKSRVSNTSINVDYVMNVIDE